MRPVRYLISAMALAACAGAAAARPSDTGGMIPSDDPTGKTRTVNAGDFLSLSLYRQSSGGSSDYINNPGVNVDPHVLVGKGPIFHDLGVLRGSSQNAHVQASWDEVVSSNLYTIRIRFRTTSGEAFVPVGSTISGQPVQAWTWKAGLTDPVDFQDWVSTLWVQSAVARFSNDGGATYTAGSLNFTNSLPVPWVPGRDAGVLRSASFDTSNAVLLEYKLHVVPAPGMLACSAVGLACIAMRRRR